MASPSNEERFRALYERHHPAIIAYFVRRIRALADSRWSKADGRSASVNLIPSSPAGV